MISTAGFLLASLFWFLFSRRPTKNARGKVTNAGSSSAGSSSAAAEKMASGEVQVEVTRAELEQVEALLEEIARGGDAEAEGRTGDDERAAVSGRRPGGGAGLRGERGARTGPEV